MAKTYPLKALWPLLPFERAALPLLATLDAYDDGLAKYAVTEDGVWLFSPPQPRTVHESVTLTGYHPADFVPKQIEGVEGYFYALQGGAPLLPLPFTKDQFIEFDKRTAGLIDSCIDRGDDTDAWITDLEKDNPDAAELARGIHGGKWPLDLADIVDTKTDGAAKPGFRLASGIKPNASAMASISAYDEIQRQQDVLKKQEFASRKQTTVPETGAPKAKPVQRSTAQDVAILTKLQAMGIDPLAVPKNSPGKPGTKAEVRAALNSDPLFTGKTVFKKAWERLTNRGEIVIGT